MFPRLFDAALAYRLEGLRGVWDIMAPHSVYRLIRFGRYAVFAQSTDAPEVAPAPGVVIRRLTDEDWPALADIVTQQDLARFRWLLRRGHICLLAMRAGRPLGYAWLADRIGPDVTLCDFPLPPYAAYLWELYVLPAERRSGVGSALASARLRVARERGFQEGWRMIAPNNHASLRTLEKSGASTTRRVGEVRFLKLLSLMRVRLDGWATSGVSSS